MLKQVRAAIMLKTPNEAGRNVDSAYDKTASLGDFLPDLDTIVKTAHFFRDLGFKVWPYPHYLKVEATPQLFKQTLGVIAAQDEDKLQTPGALRGVLVRVMFTEQLAEAS